MATNVASKGRVSQVIGTVVDVEFPSGNLPEMFNAVKITSEGGTIVAEVEQHLGNNWVRCLAMNSTMLLISWSVIRAPWARINFAEPGGR